MAATSTVLPIQAWLPPTPAVPLGGQPATCESPEAAVEAAAKAVAGALQTPTPVLPVGDHPAADEAHEVAPAVEGGRPGDATPWQKRGWDNQDLLEYLANELEDTKRLFECAMTPDTHIHRSALAQEPATLTFKDLSFEVKPGTKDAKPITILEPTSGSYRGGQLVAIMGPSGCGKTTLLDMLANKKTAPYKGEVLVNGHRRDYLFQRISAYVGHEDVMPQFWTVQEAVQFNLELKATRCRNVPREFEKKNLDILLASVGLSHVADTYLGGPRVRGISGGQRRRVLLARGMAQKASILFADEPTSGLSATDAELVIRSLRILAKKYNSLIMVVIKQPRVEVADLFDELLLLTSEPGRLIYSGPMKDAVAHWADCGFPVPKYANPSDFFLDLATPGGELDQVAVLMEHFRKTQKPGLDALVAQRWQEKGMTAAEMIRAAHRLQEEAQMAPVRVRLHKLAAPLGLQLRMLMRRKLALTVRNPLAIIMPIVVPIFTGLIIGLMFQGIGDKPFVSQFGFIFMFLMTVAVSSMELLPGLLEERTYMKYDISEGLYAVGPWIAIGMVVDIALSLVGVVLRCLVMYALSGMPWEYFGMILGWGLLDFFVFDSWFGVIGSLAPSVQIAQVSAIPFLMVFIMFSGYMITKASAPSWLRWVFEISPLGYAVEDIFVTMAGDYGLEGQFVVREFAFESGRRLQGVLIMLAAIVVLRMLQVAGLNYVNNIQK